MHAGDITHPNETLHKKLRRIYALRTQKTLCLDLRDDYRALLAALGNPHLYLPPTIHVAGTNGKGSVIATLRAILACAGLSVHAYTSPHLLRFNERIVLAGAEIADGALETLLNRVLMLNGTHSNSFFEITTALAFDAFAKRPADVLLLETGLGGRLDCTNIIEKPLATIITAISYDHQDYLGENLLQIANEKAGIIKPGAPCIIAMQSPEAINSGILSLFCDRAAALGAPLFIHGQDWDIEQISDTDMRFRFEDEIIELPVPSLIGAHQIQNAGCALAALFACKHALVWTAAHLEQGLRCIRWPGRFEQYTAAQRPDFLPSQTEFWYDGGHNIDAAQAIAVQLDRWNRFDPKPLHLILGMKGDKDAAAFIGTLAPHCESITHIDLPAVASCLNATEFKTIMAQFPGCRSLHQDDIFSALLALANQFGSNKNMRILMCGSLYLAQQLNESLAHAGKNCPR